MRTAMMNRPKRGWTVRGTLRDSQNLASEVECTSVKPNNTVLYKTTALFLPSFSNLNLTFKT